jgi:2-methylisocitrate lyase-like PEP mutase family enzyme
MPAQSNSLREALELKRFVTAAGVYDALGARLAEVNGLQAVYMSGLSVTASLIARPDLELLGMAEMVRQAALITSAVSIPVIADADTGYGGLSNIERTVQSYRQAGVAAIHLEDQASPKRCGHLGGVRLIPEREMRARYECAVESNNGSTMLIIGRTDAFKAQEHGGLDEAVRRAKIIARTGVDVIFVDGLIEKEHFRRVRDEVGGYLLASIVEIDKPASVKVSDLEEMGYSIAVFPLSAILAATKAIESIMKRIARDGDTGGEFDNMTTYSELNFRMGIEKYHQLWNRHDISKEEKAP